jgi:hypothetical protein
VFILLSALLSCSSLDAAAESSDVAPDEPVEAIWHIQQMNFRFRSDRTSYACDELERKVANILRAVGAREDIAVDSGCFRGQFVTGAVVQVTLASPVPATQENVRRATTFDSRDELLARLHHMELPTGADVKRFPAVWRSISLHRHRRARLEQADCDLFAAIRKQVFPKLAIRVDEQTLSCTSMSSRIRPRVDVAALVPEEVATVAFVER